MIKVFIPEIKRKYNKPSSRGFWVNDTGKVYYDYVTVKEYKQSVNGLMYESLFFKYLDNLRIGYNQECIFFINGIIGNVYYSKDKTVILPHRIIKEVLRVNLKNEIKTSLKQYKGCTVYNESGKYFIEVFATI